MTRCTDHPMTGAPAHARCWRGGVVVTRWAGNAVRCVAGAILILTCFGCSKPLPDFQLKLDAPGSSVFTQYKLVVDGAPVGPLPSSQAYESTVHPHKADSPQDMLPHIEASVLYVCGWQPAKLEMHPPSEFAIEQARKDRLSVPIIMYLDFERPSWQEVVVLVDNRDGPAGRISVGEYERPLAAGQAVKMSFPYWPHCAQATQLRLNGETIGNIEEDTGSPGTALPLLLDTSGQRCYRFEWQTYSNSPAFGGSGNKTFKPQKLRVLSSSVDYFLQPLSSAVHSTESVVQRSSLNEMACAEAK